MDTVGLGRPIIRSSPAFRCLARSGGTKIRGPARRYHPYPALVGPVTRRNEWWKRETALFSGSGARGCSLDRRRRPPGGRGGRPSRCRGEGAGVPPPQHRAGRRRAAREAGRDGRLRARAPRAASQARPSRPWARPQRVRRLPSRDPCVLEDRNRLAGRRRADPAPRPDPPEPAGKGARADRAGAHRRLRAGRVRWRHGRRARERHPVDATGGAGGAVTDRVAREDASPRPRRDGLENAGDDPARVGKLDHGGSPRVAGPPGGPESDLWSGLSSGGDGARATATAGAPGSAGDGATLPPRGLQSLSDLAREPSCCAGSAERRRGLTLRGGGTREGAVERSCGALRDGCGGGRREKTARDPQGNPGQSRERADGPWPVGPSAGWERRREPARHRDGSTEATAAD